MAKIHGLAYIIVGAIVAAVSWKVDFNDLVLFFYLGIGFAVVGLFKIFIGLAKKNEEEKATQSNALDEKPQHLHHVRQQNANHAARQGHARHAQAGHPQQRQAHPHSQRTHPAQARQQYKRCRNCGNVARLQDNFCSNCGYSV